MSPTEKATLYSGDYSTYERRRAEALVRQAALYERQQAEIARIQKFANRFRAKATKAKQVQSRLKALDRMARVAPVLAESPYRFAFPNPDKVPNPIISVDDASIGYDDAPTPILDDVTLRVYARDRIGILGVNGAGKTTLLKVLAGQMGVIQGDLERAGSAGYFAQHQMETLDAGKSAPGQPPGRPGGRAQRPGSARLPGWMGVQRQHGYPPRRDALWRREGAPGTRPDRAFQTLDPAPGRTDQPSRSRHARSPRRRATGIRRRAAAGVPRPPPAAGSAWTTCGSWRTAP